MRAPVTIPALAKQYGSVTWKAVESVAVFPELGLAYNRIKKNANTSVMILLRQLAYGVVDSRKEAKRKSKTLLDLSLAELRSLDPLHLFVVIRNPYSRVLSAFLDKFRDESYRRRYGTFDLTPDGFGQFLVWVERGGLTRNGHWNLQTSRMISSKLETYDTVIRFERFRDELVDMLRARDIAIPEDCLRELYPSDQTKRTDASTKLHAYYNAERRDRVASIYASDFALLDYPIDFHLPVAASNDDACRGGAAEKPDA
ncbi:MAG: sulfotransferase family 2 domain-containing protein [Kiritimatiellia bacterium]